MTKPIKCILAEFIEPKDSWKIVILTNWESIVGHLKNTVHIQTILDDHLVLGVSHPALAQELLYRVPTIKQKINTLLQQDRIKKICFRIVSKSSQPNEIISKSNSGNCLKRTSCSDYALTIEHYSALTAFKNEELKVIFERFFVRCLQQGDFHEKES